MPYFDRPWLVRHTLITLGLALALVGLSVFYWDQVLALFFARESLQTVYYYSREITEIGNSIHYFVIALTGLFFSKVLYPLIPLFKNRLTQAQNDLIFYWSLFLLKALLLCGLALHLVKFSFGRLRPHASDSFYPLSFDPLNFHHHWQSFPSGHTQVLFTVATTAFLIWPKTRYLFLFLATFFAFTRVTIHQHFFSDTIGGAAIGYLVTVWAFHLWPPARSH